MKNTVGSIARSLVTRALRPAARRRHELVPNRIAILKIDRIGDLVLAAGAIALILRTFGANRCVLVVSAVAAPFARILFPDVQLVILPAALGHLRTLRAARKVRNQLRDLSPERTVCLRHQRWDYDELTLAWLGGREVLRIEDGSTRRWRPDLRTYDCPLPGKIELTSTTVCERPETGFCEELVRHAVIVSKLLGREISPLDIRSRLSVGGVLDDAIVVSPLASETVRDIPKDLLAVAAKTARKSLPQSTFLLVGLVRDLDRLEQYANELRGLGTVRFATDISPTDYIDIVGRARLVISADSATAHIATACDRPLVAFLGGGHFGQFAPWRWSNRQEWLTQALPCFGCNWQCTQPDVFCLKHIAPTIVTETIGRVLSLP